MYKTWLVLLTGLLVLAVTSHTQAQQEVLDSLIDLALRNNPELGSAIQQSLAEYESAGAAGALPDPVLSFAAMNLPSSSWSLDQTPMSGIGMGLTQKLPWPSKLAARSDLADNRHLKSQARERLIQNRLVREVTEAYVDYSYWSEIRSIIRQYQHLLSATRDIAEVRYANGEVAAQDVIRSSAMISRTEIRLLSANQGRHSALLQIGRLVGDIDLPGELPSYLPEPGAWDSAPVSLDANPVMNDAALSVEQASHRYQLARSNYWPDFSVGIDYRFRQQVPGDPVRGVDFLTFKLALNLPLWFFAKQDNQVASAKLQSLASQEHVRSVRELLTTRWADTQSGLELTIASLRQYDQSINPEVEAAVEAAEIAYEVGQADFNALLAAQSDAFEVRLERLNLLRRYHKSRARLVELSGESLRKVTP